jgi:glucokinase
MGADSLTHGSDVLSEVEASAGLSRLESGCVIGADVGATKIAVGAVDQAGAIIFRREAASPSQDQQLMVRSVTRLITDAIESARREGFEVAACGVGAAAFVLHAEGLLLSAPNISWSDVPLQRLLREATGLPSFVDNDATAAAAGEHLAGVCTGVDDFVYLTLGTGIGGGIFVGGRLYRGHKGTAAEFGHMTLDPEGPLCACGRRGCLEAMASGTALEREASALAEADKSSLLCELRGGVEAGITGEIVSAAAERGDPAALEAFRRVGYNLGLGVVNLIHAFDPSKVVLGGGMSRSGHFLLDEVARVVSERGLPELTRGVEVVLSGLGADAGLVGAGAIAWEGIGGPS